MEDYMKKLEIIKDIDSLLVSKLTEQERQHLSNYVSKELLGIILFVLQTKQSQGVSFREWFTLDDKAKAIVNRLKPHLQGYSEYKAIDELSNTTHGVLNKLKESL
jgi:hypothetical protein